MAGHRSSHRRCSVRKSVLKNFTKFTGKETLAQLFSCEFCEIFKNTLFIEHLWETASKAKLNTTFKRQTFLLQQNFTESSLVFSLFSLISICSARSLVSINFKATEILHKYGSTYAFHNHFTFICHLLFRSIAGL